MCLSLALGTVSNTFRRRRGALTEPQRERRRDAPKLRNPWTRARTMDDDTEFSTMDDPAFLAERKRVRETIEALTERYQRLNAEFDRRASAAWSEAGR